MITLHYTEESYEGVDSYYPEVDMLITIDNEGISWDMLMKSFAHQLPKMGYHLNVDILESMIDEASRLNRVELLGKNYG